MLTMEKYKPQLIQSFTIEYYSNLEVYAQKLDKSLFKHIKNLS